MQDGAERAAKDTPPACSAVLGRVHAEPAVHDRDGVPAGRVDGGHVQADQRQQGGHPHIAARSAAGTRLR